MNNDFLQDLAWRGLIAQGTDLEGLAARMNREPVAVYAGFDPTATSLHVGNLIPLIALARFQKAGHRALALVGGATGLIGDPSGKNAERVLQTPEDVALRTEHIRAQLAQFVDVSDSRRGAIVNNLAWTAPVTLLDFLRDIGKHFSVNAMIHRDSVRSRLEREGEGISFTEFSYMLLQGFDFLKLAEQEGCSVQIGGSDQWGNMCSGVELIRRKLGKEAFALTFPLLTTHDGQKFGKTVKGAIWLDKAKTPVWEFFQFWLNVDDKDVIRFLKFFTFVPREEIEALEQATAEAPHLRAAQRKLALEMTSMVHGSAAAGQVEAAAQVLFGKGDAETLSVETWEALALSVPSLTVAQVKDVPPLGALLVALKLEASLTKAQTLLRSGAVSLNNQKVEDAHAEVSAAQLLHGRFLLVKKGKKHFALVCVQMPASEGLTDAQVAFKAAFQAAAQAKATADAAYWALRHQCSHHFEQVGDSAHCVLCGVDGGWWCPDNPGHVCQYEGSDEECVHCGAPEERK